jgi:hypothetical protein
MGIQENPPKPDPKTQRARLEELRKLAAAKKAAEETASGSETVTPENTPDKKEEHIKTQEELTRAEDGNGQAFTVGETVCHFYNGTGKEYLATIQSFKTNDKGDVFAKIFFNTEDGRRRESEIFIKKLDKSLEILEKTEGKDRRMINKGDIIVHYAHLKSLKGNTRKVETIKRNPITNRIWLYLSYTDPDKATWSQIRDLNDGYVKIENTEPAPTPGHPIGSEPAPVEPPPAAPAAANRAELGPETFLTAEQQEQKRKIAALKKIFEIGRANISDIERLGYTNEEARGILRELEDKGIIAKIEEGVGRKLIITLEQQGEVLAALKAGEPIPKMEEVRHPVPKLVRGELLKTREEAGPKEIKNEITEEIFKVSDVVWNIPEFGEQPEQYTIESIDSKGKINVISQDDGLRTYFYPDQLTHTKPAPVETAQEQGEDTVLAELLDPEKKLYFDGGRVKEMLGDEPTKEKYKFTDEKGTRTYYDSGNLDKWETSDFIFRYSYGKLYQKIIKKDETYEEYGNSLYNQYGVDTTNHYTAKNDLIMTTDTNTGEVLRRFDADNDKELRERLSRTIKVNGKDKKLSELLNKYGNGTVDLGNNETKTYNQGRLERWIKQNGDIVSYDEQEEIHKIIHNDGKWEIYNQKTITYYKTDYSHKIVDRATGKILQRFDREGKEIPLTAEDKAGTLSPEIQEDQTGENEAEAEMEEGGEVETSLDSLYITSLKNAFKQEKTSINKIMQYAEITINEETAQKILDRMIKEGMVERKADKYGVHEVIPSKLRQRKILEGLETGVVISTKVNKEKEKREIRLKNNKKELEEIEKKLKILDLQEEIEKMEIDLININSFRFIKRINLRNRIEKAKKELKRIREALL